MQADISPESQNVRVFHSPSEVPSCAFHSIPWWSLNLLSMCVIFQVEVARLTTFAFQLEYYWHALAQKRSLTEVLASAVDQTWQFLESASRLTLIPASFAAISQHFAQALHKIHSFLPVTHRSCLVSYIHHTRLCSTVFHRRKRRRHLQKVAETILSQAHLAFYAF